MLEAIGSGAWAVKLSGIGVLLRDSKDPAEAYVNADTPDFLAAAESK